MGDQMGSVEEAMGPWKHPRTRLMVVLLGPDTIRSIAPVLEKSGFTKATMGESGESAAKLDYYDGDDDERNKGNWKPSVMKENLIEFVYQGKGALGFPLKGWDCRQVMQVYDQGGITNHGLDATINGATIIKEAENWDTAIDGDAVLTKAFDWEPTIDEIKVCSKFGQVPAKAYDTGFAIIGSQVLVPAYDFGAVINDGQVLVGAYGLVIARDWTGCYHGQFLMEVGLGDTASHLMNGMLDPGAVTEPCD